MEYTTLGSSGTKVSRICVGCGRFGSDDEAKLGPDAAAELVDRAIDLGVNFFDTSNSYSDGESERILGRALADHGRDWPVVATKVFSRVDERNPNARGLSRKAVEQELENSLDRLGMETVDLYQTHGWDHTTPIEETLRAFDDAVGRGQVRHVGLTSVRAYQLARAHAVADREALSPVVSMQAHYNLAYREAEREVLPFCLDTGVGLNPWSPLARGFLARPHEDLSTTARGRRFADSARAERYRSNGGEEINRRAALLAEDFDVSMAQLALAWLLHQDGVDAPVVGLRSIEHLEEAVEALEIDLRDSDVSYLEAPYEPKPIDGVHEQRE